MRKFIVTMVLGLAFVSNAFATHCPEARDFIQMSGYIWGTYWDLIPSAAKDWYIADKHVFSAANLYYFPNETTLLVRIAAKSGEVKCLYLLPNNARIAVLPLNVRKVDKGQIDLRAFTPQHLDNYVNPTRKTRWQNDDTVTSLACNATAASAHICRWAWV